MKVKSGCWASGGGVEPPPLGILDVAAVHPCRTGHSRGATVWAAAMSNDTGMSGAVSALMASSKQRNAS